MNSAGFLADEPTILQHSKLAKHHTSLMDKNSHINGVVGVEDVNVIDIQIFLGEW